MEEGVAKLSGGNQQKVVLAKWMFTDPDVLILDEPTPRDRRRGQVRDLRHRQEAVGKAVIVISSEPPELLGLSDRIYTIFEGAITGILDKDQASQESLMKKLMTSARKPPDPFGPTRTIQNPGHKD